MTKDDLQPTPPDRRTLTAWDVTGLWVGLVIGVPTYYLAGSLVELGMTWWQGVTTIVLGNVVTLIVLLLTAVPGTRYGIPFPVLAKAAFGVRGAHVPCLLRALIACGWFGIETWIGGQALMLLLPSSVVGSWPPLPGLGVSAVELACFGAFLLLQVAVVWKGMTGIHALSNYAAPILVLLIGGLFCWATNAAGGLARLLDPTPRLPASKFWALFFPSLTASVGSWATIAINIPDFTRYVRSQADQITGQLPLPLLMGVFTFAGLAITSASAVVFGAPISNPVLLVSQICRSAEESSSGWFFPLLVRVLSAAGITLATITTNVPANVVAPANVLVSLAPSVFRFETAALLTAAVGVLFQPWRVFGSSGSFINEWLVGYSCIMGPISGVLLADYYAVRRTSIDVKELYCDLPWGEYYYRSGYNPRALTALAVAIGPMIPGFLRQVGVIGEDAIPRLFVVIYSMSWFFGFFAAAAVHCVLCSAPYLYFPFLHRRQSTTTKSGDPLVVPLRLNQPMQ